MPAAFILDGPRAAERLHFAEYGARFASWEFDTERCVLLTGPNYNQLHGLPADCREISMAEILAMILPDDHVAMQSAIAALSRTQAPAESLSVDLRVRLPEDEVRWMEARFAWVPTTPGRPRRLFGISLDIAARKAMEATLRDSRAWLDLAMSSIGMAPWDHDLRSARIRTSGNYGRLYGLDDERREWTTQEFGARIAPADQELVRQRLTPRSNMATTT